MDILNLLDSNGYKEICDIWWIGQTFKPTEDTDFHYFYYNIRWWFEDHVYFEIYEAGPDHLPLGSPIYTATDNTSQFTKTGYEIRSSIYLEDCPTLISGKEYFLLLKASSYSFEALARVYTIVGSNPYANGCLWYTTNHGVNWTQYPNDDLVFALTGSPYVPKHPPKAPVNNFAVLNVTCQETYTGVKIMCITNVPIKARCYWTNHEPDKHLISALRRGTKLWKYVQYCFVDWHENLQAENGDCIFHTFTKEPWPACETRWFIFRGTVKGIWSPSVSPIFSYHRVGIPPPTTYTFRCDDETGYFMRTGTNWAYIWGLATGLGYENQKNYTCRSYKSGSTFYCSRGRLRFNTSTLPDDCNIVAARIYIALSEILPLFGSVYLLFTAPEGCGPEMNSYDYSRIRLSTTPIASVIWLNGTPIEEYIMRPFNDYGLSKINKTGYSIFGLRNSIDLAGGPPIDNEWQVGVLWHGDQYAPSPIKDAYLEVDIIP